MSPFFASILLISIYLGLTILKMRRLAKRDREFLFNNRLSEISDRQRIVEINPTAYRKIYQERPWDELDKAIDRQIRAGEEVDVSALREVFLQQTVS